MPPSAVASLSSLQCYLLKSRGSAKIFQTGLSSILFILSLNLCESADKSLWLRRTALWLSGSA